MVMQLRRRSDNLLITNAIDWFEGWNEKYMGDPLETVNGVTYLQRRGRMEWIGAVTFVFSDRFAGTAYTSPLANMYLLKRLARNTEWLRFTDKWGGTYDVRVRGNPTTERDSDAKADAVFYLDCDLLMRGYE